MSDARLADAELHELDAVVEDALARRQEGELRVLGYGEISLVLAWPPQEPAFACKRLPAFPSRARFEAYRETLYAYLGELRARGVEPVATEFRPVERGDGTVAGYAIQPAIHPASLGPAVLSRADPSAGHPLVGEVVAAAEQAIGPRVGIDAQLANWTWEEGRLRFLDITTPMLWDEGGRPLLDMELLTRPLPAPLRRPVSRWLAPRILDGYRNLRGVMLDLCGNLIKERLEGWIAPFREAVAGSLERPLTDADVRRYYRSDARLWGFLLRVRRLDRAWQHHVRRRSYEFLLPGEIRR